MVFLSKVAIFFCGVLFCGATAWSQSVRFPGELGAIPYEEGVTFRVWAPNATAMGVKGDFNGWSTTALVRESESDYWSVDVAGAHAGQEYKYRINNSFDRRDPRARRVTNSNGNSVIYDPDAFDWEGVPMPAPWRNDVVFYQMHLGTFGGQNPPSTFDQAIERLDHIRDLGISAIKLMPVNEFAGGRSWGYNPSDLFAIESDYGGPDAMKRFVQAAHERGLAVVMDVVHNHYGPSDLDMWQFDGWSQNNLGGIYFYNDDRAHTPWGSTRPDFGRSEVQQFIRDQIFMWVEEYRIGGFRWDSIYNIINTDQGHNPQGEHMVRDINWELSQAYPDVIRGAEDNAFDFNINFEHQWDVDYRWSLRSQVVDGSDAGRNMWVVRDLLANWAGHQRVVFSEAHDYIAANHGRTRIPSDIHWDEPESIWARKRSLLAAGIVMTTPGIPMIFQGQEMLETQAFHDDTPLRWDRATTYAGIVQAYSDLIHARRNLRGGMQGLKGTGIDVHHVNDEANVIAYVRWDAGGGADDVVVVGNFSVNVWTNSDYMVDFPSDGTWYRHFNSDSTAYSADFGNIGDETITVSDGEGAVNMGMYSLQIFSRTPPEGKGQVSFDPGEPSGCVPVTVQFDPADGPLAGAAQVVLYYGRNGWQDIGETNMVAVGDGTWNLEVSVPEGTFEVNVAFHDGVEGEERVWDTNEDRNWSVPISNCAGLPGLAVVDPAYPHGCTPVTIEYRVRDGVLADAETVNLFIGRNGWLNVQTLTMAEVESGVWSVEYPVADGTWQLDFVFNDGNPDEEARIWDNNDWNNWQVYVIGCVDSDYSGIVITNPASDLSVPYTQTVFSVGGGSSRLAGDLHWTNQGTGESGVMPVADLWDTGSLPLDVGANLFRVTGTGITDNPNDGAQDDAGHVLYSYGWQDGQNGGTNWGGGWSLGTSGSAGYWLANGSDENQDTGPLAWMLWANGGGESWAVRPFADRLHSGDIFSMRFENNWVAGGGTVGVALQNRFGQNLFEFLFIGDGTNYIINDAVLDRQTGIPWTGSGLDLVFELVSGTGYRFEADGTVVTGELAATSENLVRQVRIFNFNAGGGWEHNVYFSNLAIDGAPLPAVEHSSSRTINRRYGPHFESWVGAAPDEMVVRFPVTEAGYWYDVHYTTNLVDGAWNPMNLNRTGNGSPLAITLTNTMPQLYIRTSVTPLD
jgi:1,4-alpha-glucan branching enzyme